MYLRNQWLSSPSKEIAEYAGQTYKYSANICRAIEDLQQPTIDLLDKPENGATLLQVRMWEKCYDMHIKCMDDALDQDVQTMYSVVLGQCMDAMRAKVEGHDHYVVVAAALDAIGLLHPVQDISFNFQSQKYTPLAIHKTVCRIYLSKQGEHMMMQEYLELFTNNKNIMENCSRNIGMHSSLIRVVLLDEGNDIATGCHLSQMGNCIINHPGEIPCNSFSHEFRQEVLWRPASGT
jgi:hypothetical protein